MRAVPWRHVPRVVEYQLGRVPRTPWRVVVGCKYGQPQVIASPSKLDDGELFPQWVWLTCPFLCKVIARVESEGGCEEATAFLERRPRCAEQLLASDILMREMRAKEDKDGKDHCEDVGLAGSKDPLKVKCLHAHVAYHLAGLNNPVGKEFLTAHSRTCASRNCLKNVPYEA